MTGRIRRNRRGPSQVDCTEIERLMKSISQSQEAVKRHNANIAMCTVELYDEMKRGGIQTHAVDGIIAERFRPKGRATNKIDPQGFREAVADDADFYGAVSVSITAAKKVLSEKQLKPIMSTTPGKLGEETVRVSKGGS